MIMESPRSRVVEFKPVAVPGHQRRAGIKAGRLFIRTTILRSRLRIHAVRGMDVGGRPVWFLSHVFEDHRVPLGDLKRFRVVALLINKHGNFFSDRPFATLQLGAGRHRES